MYAQTAQAPAGDVTTTARRAALRTRPAIQRAFIRSWEYNQPVRVTVLVIRLLVVMWLLFLAAVLLPAGDTWAWILPPAAVAVFAFSVWVFGTAAKGSPAVKA